MFRSLRIARIKGVDLRINPVLIILLIIGIYFGYFQKSILLLLAVLLHESAHSTVAFFMGFRVSEIELMPLGGVVRVEGLFQANPSREAVIAFAGPAFSIVLAFFIIEFGLCTIPQFFVTANMAIGIFNLMPIFPLDGGRILRAVLSYRWGYVKATKNVSNLSRIISVIMFGTAFYMGLNSPLFVTMAVAAVFLFFASAEEKKIAPSLFINQIESKKRLLFDRGTLRSRCLAVASNTGVKKVIKNFLPGYYHVVFVIGQDGEILGKIGEDELIRGIMKYGYNVDIGKLLYNNK